MHLNFFFFLISIKHIILLQTLAYIPPSDTSLSQCHTKGSFVYHIMTVCTDEVGCLSMCGDHSFMCFVLLFLVVHIISWFYFRVMGAIYEDKRQVTSRWILKEYGTTSMCGWILFFLDLIQILMSAMEKKVKPCHYKYLYPSFSATTSWFKIGQNYYMILAHWLASAMVILAYYVLLPALRQEKAWSFFFVCPAIIVEESKLCFL